MNLYVWSEEILADYTDGMCVALAESEEEARALLIKALGWDERRIANYPDLDGLAKAPNAVVPVTEKCAFYCHGGS